jgi:hypothetical protein
LTRDLCEAAWGVFQKTETGTWPSGDSGARRSLPLIGTSAYQLKTEFPAEVEVP